MIQPLSTSWKENLSLTDSEQHLTTLLKKVEAEYQNSTVYPQPELIFNAFTLCPWDKVRVVILGQDPYHSTGQAHGLAFSVPKEQKIPPSLRNIYKELESDTGTPPAKHGNLEAWANQGVLLLNSTLTVKSGQAGSHRKIGWETFTDTVIKTISEKKEHVVFVLWGKAAEQKRALIDESKHLLLSAPHPSPLSAHTGFFGSRPFSKTNDYLASCNMPKVNWGLH